MNRREALKNLTLLITGAAFIPGHLRSANGPSIKLSQLHITASQEELLGEIVETLLPTTTTPGAKELNIHLFVLLMLNDCHDQPDQTQFINGLNQLNAFSVSHSGQNFAACTPAQRLDLLTKLQTKADSPPPLWSFNRLMRQRAIQGYRESEYVMTELIPHQMIPPAYDGYYPAGNYDSKEGPARG